MAGFLLILDHQNPRLTSHNIPQLVDHLFRHESGKLVAVLTTPNTFHEDPYNQTTEIIVGYYHILANNMDEAITIAKANPEFAFVKGAKIEVRPIKTKEQSTNFDYPS